MSFINHYPILPGESKEEELLDDEAQDQEQGQEVLPRQADGPAEAAAQTTKV